MQELGSLLLLTLTLDEGVHFSRPIEVKERLFWRCTVLLVRVKEVLVPIRLQLVGDLLWDAEHGVCDELLAFCDTLTDGIVEAVDRQVGPCYVGEVGVNLHIINLGLKVSTRPPHRQTLNQ